MKLNLSSGYSTFDMQNMKICQESFASLYLFKSKFYSNYPGFINFGGSVEYHYDIGAGLSIGYHHDATGSKSSYKDYTGEFSDIYQLASNTFTFGLIFDSKIVGVEIKNLKLYFITDIGFKSSSVKKEEFWEFLNKDTLISGNFSSVSGILEPQLRITYPYKNYEFGLSLGYHQDFGGRYKNDSKFAKNNPKDEFLNDPLKSRIISSEWSGIRLKANVTLYIMQLFERPDRTEWE
jgi:hypothetical protein